MQQDLCSTFMVGSTPLLTFESLHSFTLSALWFRSHADSVLLAGGHDRGSCNGSLASLFPTEERAKEVPLFRPALPTKDSIRNSQGITLEQLGKVS